VAEAAGRQGFRFPAFPLYPLADSAAWVARLLDAGLEIVQLRLKTRPAAHPELEIPRALAVARRAGARLLVNGHWQLAMREGAYGVHLSRVDWPGADLAAIRGAGLVLGASVHSAIEIEQALTLAPDYLTLGTVYPSPSKGRSAATLGLAAFAALRQTIPVPTAAIGGLTVDNAAPVLAAGADAIAVISDLVATADLAARIDQWRALFSRSKAAPG